MSKNEVNIHIEPTIKTIVKKTWLKAQMDAILGILSPDVPSEVGLFITNNQTIRMLNKTYRHKNEPTDVLAFSMAPIKNKENSKTVDARVPDGIDHLGEVIISYLEAIVQAESKGHDIKTELLILMIHGMLHLFGYDHEQSKEEAQRMRRKERGILKKIAAI